MSTNRSDDHPQPTNESPSAASRLREEIESKRSNLNDPDPEEQLWSGGYSGKAMIGTWLLLGLITIGLVVAAVAGFVFALIAIPVIWLIGGIRYAMRRMGVHYQLTSQRFIHQKGILTRQTDRIEVIDLDDVSFTQGPVERIFSVGTIVLTGSDRTHPTLSMIGISDVKEVAGLIDDVRREERRRRSLHIEQI